MEYNEDSVPCGFSEYHVPLQGHHSGCPFEGARDITPDRNSA
jgi:hypothetical protein